MHAYLPKAWSHGVWVLAWLPLTLGVGFGLVRLPHQALARIGAWLWVGLSFGGAHWLCLDDPAGFRMLAICGVVLFAMKAVVGVEVRWGAKPLLLKWPRWLAWAGAWPGMKPDLFAERDEHPDRAEAWALFRRGSVRFVLGLALLLAAHLSWKATQSLLLATILALPGISLMLHFGLFNWMSAFWRFWGFRAEVLFPAPLMSTSLTEFWGRRWNLPFTEMTQRAVYWPLSGPLGRNVAALCGFVFSGLLHEMAISVPVQAGFGLPALYFVIHGGLVLLERVWLQKQRWFAQRPWLGRGWTLVCLALPMPILFHPPFLRGVVWPLLGISA